MKKIKKILKFTWRGLVLTFREVFTGLMLGISALLILVKLGPGSYINVGYLVMFGILAGLMKGLSKFILMELLNKLPADELSKNYPKFKMMFLWIVIFIIAAFANYGFNLTLWLAEPARFIHESYLLGQISQENIFMILLLIVLLGIASYVYEPVYKD